MEKLLSAAGRVPLGTLLVERGLITQAQLDDALKQQAREGGRLGDILVNTGALGYYALYESVAENHQLPFVNLLTQPPDPRLLRESLRDTYLQLRLLPWQRKGRTVVIAVCEVTLETMLWIRQHFGVHTELVVTSPVDIRRSVETFFGASLQEESCLKLWKSAPHASARHTLLAWQKRMLATMLTTLACALWFSPLMAIWWLVAFCHGIYFFTMLFKCFIFFIGQREARIIDWTARLNDLREKDLPCYTVLIPMYREAESLPHLLAAMQRLDYPAAKLDIKLVLEADDDQTLAAAHALKPSYRFDIVRVPAHGPRTKPKACNYALRFARGEYVTIFDADDRPDPLQLKKAVWMFRHHPDDVVCLQARLNYFNSDDNLLTRYFTLEYSILFDAMLPGLERCGIPLPLGGTSNHISLARLRELGEWDPYNVTEDADLGIRITAMGLRTLMLDSLTLEESPIRVAAWIRQRSRWIKGYMQTWLVHMRSPAQLFYRLGLRGFIGFQFFMGLSTFVFLSAPLMWAICALWAAGAIPLAAHQGAWLEWFTLINLGLNLAVSSWLAVLRYEKLGQPRLWAAAITYPCYLVLHCIASYKALFQLIVKPHYWEKTMHGLYRQARGSALTPRLDANT